MVPLGSAGLERCQEKVDVSTGCHRLAAGEGHTTAGLVVEDAVLVQLEHQGVDGVGPADHGARARGAGLGASAAAQASSGIGAIDGRVGTRGSGEAERTDLETGVTHNTAFGDDRQHRSKGPAFGVVAPGAAQGAPFEKDSGADPRTVVNGEALDVEDDSCRHGCPVLPSSLR